MPYHITVDGLADVGISPQAASFIRTRIRSHIREAGLAPKSAVRLAFREARAVGFKVPAVQIEGLAAEARRVIRTFRAMSPAAKKFVQQKIRTLIREEGWPRDQAVAIAFSMAKRAGFAVPKPAVAVRLAIPQRAARVRRRRR